MAGFVDILLAILFGAVVLALIVVFSNHPRASFLGYFIIISLAFFILQLLVVFDGKQVSIIEKIEIVVSYLTSYLLIAAALSIIGVRFNAQVLAIAGLLFRFSFFAVGVDPKYIYLLQIIDGAISAIASVFISIALFRAWSMRGFKARLFAISPAIVWGIFDVCYWCFDSAPSLVKEFADFVSVSCFLLICLLVTYLAVFGRRGVGGRYPVWAMEA